MRLKDKIAIITGGGRGIGEETCRLFAAEGASIMVADMDIESAEKVATEINKSGGKAHSVKVNVTNLESVKAMITTCTDTFGGLDILINNAGVTKDNLFIRMKEEEWNLVLDVNLKGTFLCSQAAFRAMRKSGGRIVNTASVASLGNPGQANYSSSKGGVISLTKTMALELARYNILVNCVAPGPVMTPMFENVPEEMRDKFREMIPLKRYADPIDIAKAHLFFCSDDSPYITGQTLFVDGGASVGL